MYTDDVPVDDGARRIARDLLTPTWVIAVAVAAGAALSGGSYALWNDTRDLPAATVQSGSLHLQIVGSLNAASWQNLLPGELVGQQVTVMNTGSVPIELEALVAAAPGFDVRLAPASCGTALSGPTDAGTLVQLGALPAAASTPLCIQVSIDAATAQGSTAAIDVTLTARQEGD